MGYAASRPGLAKCSFITLWLLLDRTSGENRGVFAEGCLGSCSSVHARRYLLYLAKYSVQANMQSLEIPGETHAQILLMLLLFLPLHLILSPCLLRPGANGLWPLAPVMLATNLTMGLYSFF